MTRQGAGRGRDWREAAASQEAAGPSEVGREKEGFFSRTFRESMALLTLILAF